MAYAAPRASPAWMASAVQIRSATSSPTISVSQWSGRARAECRAGAARAAGTAKAPPCRRLSAISPRNAGQARLRHAALPAPCRSSISRRSWRRQVAQARFVDRCGSRLAWQRGCARRVCACAASVDLAMLGQTSRGRIFGGRRGTLIRWPPGTCRPRCPTPRAGPRLAAEQLAGEDVGQQPVDHLAASRLAEVLRRTLSIRLRTDFER